MSLRFPWLAAATARLIGRLPPASRLRQAALRRGCQLAAEAYNRRDLDAVVIGYHPEIEYRPARSWVEAGFFEPCYRGPAGYRKYVALTAEVFGEEVYFKPMELIDLGEQIVVLAEAPMRAQASGIELTEAFAYVATLKDGLVTACRSTTTTPKPSKPSGCRSRRCRRRTSNWATAANDAFNRRDLHTFLALMDPAIEFVPYEVSIQGRRSVPWA